MNDQQASSVESVQPRKVHITEGRYPLRVRRRKRKTVRIRADDSTQRRLIFYNEHPMTLYRKVFMVVMTVLCVSASLCGLGAALVMAAEWTADYLYDKSVAQGWVVLTIATCVAVITLCTIVRAYQWIKGPGPFPYRQPNPNAVQHWE